MAVVGDRAQKRQLNPRGDPTSPWWHVDVLAVVVPLLLSGIGLLMIYSATRGRDSENYITTIVERQAIFLGIAAALMVLIAVTDYRRFHIGARFVYVGCVIMLVLVLIPGIGELRNGARAWFSVAGFSFQPSEVMKLGLILTLAWWLSEHPDGLDLNALGAAIGIAAVPIALVWVQPDIGTIMVFVAITAAMLLIGGIDIRHLLGVIVIGVGGLAVSWPLLADYQKERLEGFLDPGGDAASVYNVEQAQIAIGNGGLSGRRRRDHHRTVRHPHLADLSHGEARRRQLRLADQCGRHGHGRVSDVPIDRHDDGADAGDRYSAAIRFPRRIFIADVVPRDGIHHQRAHAPLPGRTGHPSLSPGPLSRALLSAARYITGV